MVWSHWQQFACCFRKLFLRNPPLINIDLILFLLKMCKHFIVSPRACYLHWYNHSSILRNPRDSNLKLHSVFTHAPEMSFHPFTKCCCQLITVNRLTVVALDGKSCTFMLLAWGRMVIAGSLHDSLLCWNVKVMWTFWWCWSNGTFLVDQYSIWRFYYSS